MFVMVTGKCGDYFACLVKFRNLLCILLWMGRLFLSGLIVIKISCLNVNCRDGCPSFGGGWDLKCSWLKLTRVKFHWMGSFSSFFNLSHHPKYVVGTRTTRKVYKKWSNIDLPLFKNTQLMGWHDLNSSVVLAYFLLFQWPLNTMVWNYKLTP